MNTIINLSDVSFSYKNKQIFQGLNLSINQSDILAVLGHNGAGKTTLLKIFAGLLKIKDGKIERNIKTSEIGYMNESLGLYPYLNAKENLDLIMLRNSNELSQEKIDYLCDLFDIKSNDIIEKYSTGMKKKLSLLGVILSNPKLFLLDEPFSGIDPISLNFITNQIKQTSNETNAFVIVNHDLPSTKKLCNKFIIIKNGNIVFYSDKKNDIENLENIYAKYSE